MKERRLTEHVHNFVTVSSFLFIFVMFLISLLSISSAADEISEYKGMGFLVKYPCGWTISASGNQIAGNMSVKDACRTIALTWMRNPGLKPFDILDQIVNTYNQSEVEIISKSHVKISVEGKDAEALDLSYKFKEHSARKRLSLWTSEKSDRLFIASISSCGKDYSKDEEVFNQVLGSFQDLESREITLDPRQIRDDSWAVLLGDLMASYHYTDQSSLSSMSISVEAIHSLIPLNGSYTLSSSEEIRSEMSKDAIIRAAIVQKILLDSGYNVALIQNSGQIWAVVEDSSGRWQSVSLNPKESWRMVGAIVTGSEGYRGLMYRNVTELIKDNSQNLSGPVDINKYMRKDCDPPRYEKLKRPATENKTWTNELQSFLDTYGYPKKYQENVFDCSNTSQICWALLKGRGYDVRLMFSYKNHPLGRHMWVVVRYPYEDERYVAVEATNTNGNGDLLHLGRVVLKDEYFEGIMYNTSMQFSWLHPEEGMWQEPGSIDQHYLN